MNLPRSFSQARQRLRMLHRRQDCALCALFIERLENPTLLVSLRRAESEFLGHHCVRGVLLAGSSCPARTDERRREETPLPSDKGANPTGQQARTISHSTAQAETRSDSIIEEQIQTEAKSLPHPAQIQIQHGKTRA